MLIVQSAKINPMGETSITLVKEAEVALMAMPQINLPTYHTIHGGIYTRTVLLKKHEALTGAYIVIPTTLIIQGVALVYIGDSSLTLTGYNIIPASKNRKQLIIALEDTYITMVMKTEATTVEEAELEFTNEAHLLMSRHEDAVNTIIITGE